MTSHNVKIAFAAVKSARIVIVGAGISGIAAASRLSKLGFDKVIVLEASHRIGGRICTASLHGDALVEMGAQWIHGEEDNVAHDYATKHGLICDDERLRISEFNRLNFRTEDGVQIDSDLCEKTFQQITTKLEGLKSWAGHQVNNVTASIVDKRELNKNLESRLDEEVSDLVTQSESVYERQLKLGLLDWFKKLQCSIDGCDSLSELSLRSYSFYKECEGNQLTNLKNGYSSVVNTLAEDVPAACIAFGKCVDRIKIIDYNRDHPMKISCVDGSEYEADHVLITVSLGVLKDKMETMFDPPLSSAKKQAIQGMGFGTVDKIFLEFERSFWHTDSTGYNLVWTNNATLTTPSLFQISNHHWSKAIFGFYAVPFAANVLCGWISGEAARQMEKIAEESAVLDICLDLIRRFTGKADLPKVINFARSKWNDNPFTRGSYSYLKQEFPEPKFTNDVLAEPVYLNNRGKLCPVMMFAGEATHSYYYSTVHGAWETGEREANRIAKYHDSCIRNPIAKL